MEHIVVKEAQSDRQLWRMPVAIVGTNVCITVAMTHLISMLLIYYDIITRSHNGLQMYYISLLLFAVLYAGAVCVFISASLKGTIWVIVCASLLSYLAFGIACISYSFLFERERFLNALHHMPVYEFLIPYMLLFPFISGAWFAGACGALSAIFLRNRYYDLRRPTV